MSESPGVHLGSLRSLVGRLSRDGRRRSIDNRGLIPAKRVVDNVSCDKGEVPTDASLPDFNLVPVCSSQANDIMNEGADGKVAILVFKTDSRKLISGTPCLSSSSSGFSITPYTENGRLCRAVRVEVGDYIVDMPRSLDADLNALVFAIKARVRSVTAGNGDEGVEADAVLKGPLGAAYVRKKDKKQTERDIGIGGFLYALDMIDNESVEGSMDALLKIDKAYLEDVGLILAQKDPVFAKFFSSFIGLRGKRERLSRFNQLVREAAEAKGIATGDMKIASSLFISYLNVILRQCVPTVSTKATGLTKGDDGIPVKIDIEKREACLDVKVLESSGDEGRRDAKGIDDVRNLHQNKIAGLVGKVQGADNQMLLDALIFAYFGVSFKDLAILFQDENIPERIEALNKQIEKCGLVVYANNEIAVIGEVKRPVRVFGAHATDGCHYDDRFKNQLGSDAGELALRRSRHRDLIDKYKEYRKEQISQARAESATKGHVDRMRNGIEDYLLAMSAVGSCATDISQRVAGIVGQAVLKKQKQISGRRAHVRGCVFDVLNNMTPEARAFHEEVKELAESFRLPKNKNPVYVNGKILLTAMIYQFHGVSMEEANILPFNFGMDGDRNLQDVIAKTNSVLAGHGVYIYESNGFLVLAKDSKVLKDREAVRKRVFLVGKPVYRPLESPLKRMIPKKII